MLLGAGALIVLTGLVHSIGGELYLFRHLPHFTGGAIFRRDALAERTLRATWHLATALGWAIGAVVIRASYVATDRVVLDLLDGALFVAAAIVLVVTRARHLGWLAIGAAALLLALR